MWAIMLFLVAASAMSPPLDKPNRIPAVTECKANEKYVSCRMGCPTDYCATDEYQYQIVCDPMPFCVGGCTCKVNYKWRSYEDPTCIPVNDCPSISCSKPNEVWASCVSPCIQESCENEPLPDYCKYFEDSCFSKCICKEGYFRNSSGTCISKRECPSASPT